MAFWTRFIIRRKKNILFGIKVIFIVVAVHIFWGSLKGMMKLQPKEPRSIDYPYMPPAKTPHSHRRPEIAKGAQDHAFDLINKMRAHHINISMEGEAESDKNEVDAKKQDLVVGGHLDQPEVDPKQHFLNAFFRDTVVKEVKVPNNVTPNKLESGRQFEGYVVNDTHFQKHYTRERENVEKIEMAEIQQPRNIDTGGYSLQKESRDQSQIDMIHGPSCTKKKNIAFLNVHRTGSTTVMSAIVRFAVNNNLNIALPNRFHGDTSSYVGFGSTINKDKIVPLPGNETYNIICNHVVYDHDAFRQILPVDTIYIGILRNPLEQFFSAMKYHNTDYKLMKLFPERSNISDALSKYLVSHEFLWNRMSYDLGLSKKHYYSRTKIQNHLSLLDNDFQLMMLTEYFDHSIIMMKRLLCWDLKDTLYISQNVGKRSEANIPLSSSVIDRLKALNMADYMLYQHFHSKFIETMNNISPPIEEELENFLKVRTEVEEFCIKMTQDSIADRALFVAPSDWNSEFFVTEDDCTLMLQDSRKSLSMLVQNAWLRYNASIQNINA